jgi:DNA polymerase
MLLRTTASNFLPSKFTIPALRDAAQHCEGCELYQHAIQTVFGRGPSDARLMLVGEMPSDEDDREGEPFVGAAGWLLDTALERAGLARDHVYITNLVKHFHWEEDGNHRSSKRPRPRHIQACRPWLEGELAVIQPRVVVSLGATAAKFFLGSGFRVTQSRGEVYTSDEGTHILPTYHPSAVLRVPKKEPRDRMRDLFLEDIRVAAELSRLGDQR